MQINDSVSLGKYSTMGLGGTAAHMTEVHNRMEVLEALSWANEKKLPVVMIGKGSNVVWRDEGFAGLLIVNKIEHFEIYQEDETNVYVTIGSGENWDSVVERCVSSGLTGIEALSLIPGTAGATPIQNVGAYGQEISNVLATIEAFDTQAKDFITIPVTDCGFGYRTSRFKVAEKGRFYITGLTLHLTYGIPEPPFYGAVQTYFDDNNITEFTPEILRQAVIEIRSAKLPDPEVVHNTGSFFGNPIINESQMVQINADQDTRIPYWQVDDNTVKISAAWLIEQAGFRGYKDEETGMATWPSQALVLVNEHAKSTADLLAFKQKIVDAVQAKFGILLEQEPELLP